MLNINFFDTRKIIHQIAEDCVTSVYLEKCVCRTKSLSDIKTQFQTQVKAQNYYTKKYIK